MIEQLGRYEILEEIGRGGFANVYRGRDTELDRPVALKELRPVLLQDIEWVKRFRREARTIARLDHPGIVPIYDVFEAGLRLFIVMRLVDGPGLDELISQRKRLSWPEVVDIVETIAAGLDYAHSQGILHRDLKPANILIDRDRGPMLSDFGLAKLAGEHSSSVSATGSVVGTPHYIAPEVWEGQGANAQSDIYALGCILYEMLTGEKIFKGTTPPVVMMAHFSPLTLPQQWPADVPPQVAAVLTTALATNPAHRYATAAEMAAALRQLDTRQPAQPSPVAAPVGRPPVPARQPGRAAPAAGGKAVKKITASGQWRGFLAHLGPYVIVIALLAVINLITSPNYPWFLWAALGWGIAVALHGWAVIFDSLTRPRGKWRGFLAHLGPYLIVITALAGMNLLSSSYPWFIWPALGWGVGVAIHLWATIISRDKAQYSQTEARAETKQEGRQASPAARAEIGSDSIRAHLAQAKAYREQINRLVQSSSNPISLARLQELAGRVDEWTLAIEQLAYRINSFQQNSLIQQDLAAVPRSIEKLEARLAGETDPAIKADLARTLANRKNQLEALKQLQNSMRRAEIKIESTLSSLGTIYPQILSSQSTNQVADYSRLSEEVDEEVRTLHDHLEAVEEVKFGRLSA